MALSRSAILRHSGNYTTREVHVPEWLDGDDDVVLVRGMTIREFEINQASLGKGEGKATAALVARCALDADGIRLFEDKDVDQIANLGLKQVKELSQVIGELSGLEDDEKKTSDAEAADDAEGGDDEGKSFAEPSAPSGSVSLPTPSGSSPTD